VEAAERFRLKGRVLEMEMNTRERYRFWAFRVFDNGRQGCEYLENVALAGDEPALAIIIYM
jgi:hypothetical protein